MFGRKKNRKIKANRISTVVGQGTKVDGNISFTGGLHVDGIVKGSVTSDPNSNSILSLSELGMIEGDVRVPIVVLNGAVMGNVFASERVELAPKSKVTGDVAYHLIEMSVGAEVNGRLLHKEKAANNAPAVSVKAKPNAEPARKNRPNRLLPDS